MFLLAKYGTQTTFTFPMVKRGVVDLAATGDWTPATGDTKVSKDGGSFANTTNNPSAVGGTGSIGWTVTITATELQCAVLDLQIVDSATKAVEDQYLKVYTYGNASAKYIVDFSDTVRFGLTALPNVASGSAGAIPTTGTGSNQINVSGGRADANTTYMTGTAVRPRYVGTALSGGGSTIGLAAATPTTSCEPGDIVVLTGGTGSGQSNMVLSLAGGGGATPVATMVQAWPTTNPDSSSTYEIVKIGGLVPAVAADVWDNTSSPTRVLTAATNITSTDAKITLDVSGYAVSSVAVMGADTLTAAALATDAVDEIQFGLSTLIESDIRDAVGLAAANLDTQLAAITPPSAATIASAVLTTQMAESYAAFGAAPTLAQALFAIQQTMQEVSTAGSMMTVKKLDGTTTAFQLTLNATYPSDLPTSIQRSS